MVKVKNKNSMRNFVIPGPHVDELTYNTVVRLAEIGNNGQASVIRDAIVMIAIYYGDTFKFVVDYGLEFPEQGKMTCKLNNSYLPPETHALVKELSKACGGLSDFVRKALFLYFMNKATAKQIYKQEREKLGV